MLKISTISATQPGGTIPNTAPQDGDTAEMLAAKSAHVLSGGSGAEVVSNTVARTFATLGFLVLADAVFSAVTPSTGYTTTGLTSVTFPAGSTLPFRFASFTLASGSVLAIKA